jgi:hypothetical protein
MAWPEFLNPRRITVQIALLVLASFTIFHIAATTHLLLYARNGPPPHPGDNLGRAATIIALLDATPAAERAALIARLATAAAGIAVTPAGGRLMPNGPASSARRPPLNNIPAGIEIWSDPEQGGIGPQKAGEVLARLNDGAIFVLTLPAPPERPPFGGPDVAPSFYPAVSSFRRLVWPSRAG